MRFRWNSWNLEHISSHGIDPRDAEAAVRSARAPYPLWRPDDKWLVWRARGGRLLQIVFILDPDDVVYVIHARNLTELEKSRYRRRRKP